MEIDPRQEWRTPPEFMGVVKREFEIEIDVSASEENAVVPFFHSASDDGLSSPWFMQPGGVAWCNPGFKNMAPWIEKAVSEVALGPGRTAVVMGLASPSTKWWKRVVDAGAEIRLLSPRVQFVAPPGIKQSSNARENCLMIFRTPPATGTRPAHIWRWEWLER